MSQQQVRGIYFKMEIDYYRKKLGTKEFKKIEEKFPMIKRISPVLNYSREEEFQILKFIGQILYGNDLQKTFYLLGVDAFHFFSENPIGKTLFALLGNDLKTLALDIPKAFNTLTIGLQFKIDDPGGTAIQIKIYNDSAPAAYYEGILEEAVRYFGYNPKTQKEIYDQLYIFTVSW